MDNVLQFNMLLWNNDNFSVKLKTYQEIKAIMAYCADRHNVHRIVWTRRGKVSHTIHAFYHHVLGILYLQFQKT